MSDYTEVPLPSFTEHHVPRPGGNLYVRDFPGAGPAFVLLHGFPDHGGIFDLVIPHLVASGRRVVTLDFLGFGASDKPAGPYYSFPQQLGDVEAVVDQLSLEQVCTVGHDAGGPAAVNFALRHPGKTASVVLMNAFYGDAPGLRVPELIELFAQPALAALSQHFLGSPEQLAWLLDFQRTRLADGLTDEQKGRYYGFLGPLIDGNFRQQPSAALAFAHMTGQLHGEVAANTSRITELRRTQVPFQLIWGKEDPYLHPTIAEYIGSQVKRSEVHALEAGHWPQIDKPDEVARLMLASEH